MADRFGYFVVHARSERVGEVSGVVENLATGEKWPFQSAADLTSRLCQWTAASLRPSGDWRPVWEWADRRVGG